MSDRAKVAYGRVSVILDRMGVLTEADGMALEAMCEAYADLCEARAQLRSAIEMEVKSEDGSNSYRHEVAEKGKLTYVTVGKSGPMARNRPETSLIADADNRLRAWMTKFGMTPADRSRVSAVDGETQADPWADL
jgi:P27 family predicted phage terminase small subunit